LKSKKKALFINIVNKFLTTSNFALKIAVNELHYNILIIKMLRLLIFIKVNETGCLLKLKNQNLRRKF